MPTIRRGTLKIGGASIPNVQNFKWDIANDYDDEPSDEEFTGTPCKVRQKVSGSFDLKKRNAAVEDKYAATAVMTYKEITITGGAEVSADRTVTLTAPHFTCAGDIPAENAGKVNVKYVAQAIAFG